MGPPVLLFVEIPGLAIVWLEYNLFTIDTTLVCVKAGTECTVAETKPAILQILLLLLSIMSKENPPTMVSRIPPQLTTIEY